MDESSKKSAQLANKDRFEALMRLAEFRLTRLYKRREYEWRLSLGLWALMAASIVTLKVRPNEWVLGAVLALIVFLHTYLWITPVGLRNQRDMRMAFYYADRAAQMIGQDAASLRIEQPPERMKSHSFRLRSMALIHDIWAARLPALITLMLAILAFLMLGRATPSEVDNRTDRDTVQKGAGAGDISPPPSARRK